MTAAVVGIVGALLAVAVSAWLYGLKALNM